MTRLPSWSGGKRDEATLPGQEKCTEYAPDGKLDYKNRTCMMCPPVDPERQGMSSAVSRKDYIMT